MSKRLNLAEIEQILQSGEFRQLLDVEEHEQFECKGEPYQLDAKAKSGYLELAKDVTSMANAKGGLILVGVHTESDPFRRRDVVKDIHPLTHGLVDEKRYRNCIKDWTYPPLLVETAWYPDPSDKSRGLLALRVESVGDGQWPCLVSKSDVGSDKLAGHLFGYFERVREDVQHFGVQRVHELIRAGRSNDAILTRLDSLARRLDNTDHSAPAPRLEGATVSFRDPAVLNRIGIAVSETGLADQPVFALASLPSMPISMPQIFESARSELVKLMESPPNLRSSGFDLATFQSSRIVKGVRRQTVADGQNGIFIWKDGLVVFCAQADANFLSWGYQADRLIISPLALVECTYNFAEFSKRAYQTAKPVPASVIYHCELRNTVVNDETCVLYAGPARRDFLTRSVPYHEAPNSTMAQTTPAVSQAESAGSAAFRILQEIYQWFNFEHDKIPYVRDIDGVKEVSPEEIVAHHTTH